MEFAQITDTNDGGSNSAHRDPSDDDGIPETNQVVTLIVFPRKTVE